MVDVAQLVESRIVIPVVVGSSPIIHPNNSRHLPIAPANFCKMAGAFCPPATIRTTADGLAVGGGDAGEPPRGVVAHAGHVAIAVFDQDGEVKLGALLWLGNAHITQPTDVFQHILEVFLVALRSN